MRALVCGGRTFSDRNMLDAALDRFTRHVLQITSLIHGDARGADRMAGDWARMRGIPVEAFPADWAGQGRAAGPIRNARMLAEGGPDLVIAFPGGRGTANMVSQAEAAGVPVYTIDIEGLRLPDGRAGSGDGNGLAATFISALNDGDPDSLPRSKAQNREHPALRRSR